MIPEEFIDWWFTPWNLPGKQAASSDCLAQRDSYSLWCKEQGIAAEIPAQADFGWIVAACTNADELCATARLFAGLMAVREQDRRRLTSLSCAEQKWCRSIAATQPLFFLAEQSYFGEDSLAGLGLRELAWRLAMSFPALWSRLRLMLDSPGQSALCDETMIQHVCNPAGRSVSFSASAGKSHRASMIRAQRCWKICRDQVNRNLTIVNER